MDDEIEVGDVVQLKSGGPLMVVWNINGSAADCEYFDVKGRHKDREISLSSLKKTHQEQE